MNKKEIFIKRELQNRVDNGLIEEYGISKDLVNTYIYIEVNGKNYKLHPEEMEYLYEQGLEHFKNELNEDFDLSGDEVELLLNKIFG